MNVCVCAGVGGCCVGGGAGRGEVCGVVVVGGGEWAGCACAAGRPQAHAVHAHTDRLPAPHPPHPHTPHTPACTAWRSVQYATGETEVLDLNEVIKDGHCSLLI